MTSQPIPSKFPYILYEENVIFFPFSAETLPQMPSKVSKIVDVVVDSAQLNMYCKHNKYFF
jgi:hypothetical protein